MGWISRNGAFCSIATGFGKRLSLKGVNKYPSSDYWESPDKASVCYQASGGRGQFETLCYSNLYPEEYKGLMEDAINQTLDKIALLTGQKYPKGFADVSKLDVEAFASEMGASVAAKDEEHMAALRELMEIAKSLGAAGLRRHGQSMRKEMKALQKERAETSAADMLRRQFNKKTAAAEIAITGAGKFDSFNAEGTEITPVYDFIKKNLER